MIINAGEDVLPNAVLTAELKPIAYAPPKAETKIVPLNAVSRGATDVTDRFQGGDTSLDEQLFDNAASLKIAMSQMAMHLSDAWRNSIRSQLDFLLTAEDWEEDSSVITRASFESFLRFVVHARPTSLPGLGVGPSGNLLASWHHEGDKVLVEFTPQAEAQAVIVRTTDRGDQEFISWRGQVASLRDFVERNGIAHCLA